MEIKKVLNLSQEEIDVLVKAGELISSLEKTLEAKDADTLSDTTKKLVKAVSDVSTRVSNR